MAKRIYNTTNDTFTNFNRGDLTETTYCISPSLTQTTFLKVLLQRCLPQGSMQSLAFRRQIQLIHRIEHLSIRRFSQYHLQLAVQFLLLATPPQRKPESCSLKIAETSAGLISAMLFVFKKKLISQFYFHSIQL